MAILGNIKDSEYFSMMEISNSDLKLIEKSYSHFLDKQTTDTAAMGFGRALHAYVLDEKSFWENFVVAPPMDRRTTQGKKDWRQLQESGKEIVSSDDWQELNQLRQNIMAHPIASNMIIGAKCEGAITGEIDGVPMRAKIDILNKGYVIDLKTCQDASSKEFLRSIIKYSYYQQAAVYLDLCAQNGLEAKNFLFIAVERNRKSCGVACYSVDQVSLDIGRAKYKRCLSMYKDYVGNPNKYKGYSDKIEVIGLPEWMVINAANGVL